MNHNNAELLLNDKKADVMDESSSGRFVGSLCAGSAEAIPRLQRPLG